jgi:hypothetical protein
MFHYLHSFNFYVIVRLHVSSLTIVSQLTVTKAQWLHLVCLINISTTPEFRH